MIYKIIAVLAIIFSVLLIWLAAKMLLNRKWIAGFLRGCGGLFAFLAAVTITLAALDISTYRVVANDKSVMTLSFKHQSTDSYLVEMHTVSGEDFSSVIHGQQWQLEARMFKWTPLFTAMGFNTGYRLASLQGRYIELQIGNKNALSPQMLSSSALIDMWFLLSQSPAIFPAVEAYTTSPGFIPMADGAIFDVVLSSKNLVAHPVNDVAKAAMANW